MTLTLFEIDNRRDYVNVPNVFHAYHKIPRAIIAKVRAMIDKTIPMRERMLTAKGSVTFLS